VRELYIETVEYDPAGNLSMNLEPASASAKKILVVDDNEIVIKTITLKLQGAGYQVITAMDGSEAVAMARIEKPDLIVLDVGFPYDVGGVPWDGFRIMEWFHRLDTVKKIPIIVITSSEEAKVKDRATAAGTVAFFQKPVEHDYLLKVIRATLGDATKPA
jgi:CheY-like chemotaxis protein